MFRAERTTESRQRCKGQQAVPGELSKRSTNLEKGSTE